VFVDPAGRIGAGPISLRVVVIAAPPGARIWPSYARQPWPQFLSLRCTRSGTFLADFDLSINGVKGALQGGAGVGDGVLQAGLPPSRAGFAVASGSAREAVEAATGTVDLDAEFLSDLLERIGAAGA
jgi:hypothetical protein